MGESANSDLNQNRLRLISRAWENVQGMHERAWTTIKMWFSGHARCTHQAPPELCNPVKRFNIHLFYNSPDYNEQTVLILCPAQLRCIFAMICIYVQSLGERQENKNITEKWGASFSEKVRLCEEKFGYFQSHTEQKTKFQHWICVSHCGVGLTLSYRPHLWRERAFLKALHSVSQ